MPFQVYEQGRGIATPWYSIFPAKTVVKTQKITGPLNISSKDQIKGDDTPVVRSGVGSDQASVGAAAVFQQIEGGEAERQPVFTAGQIMSDPVRTVVASLSVASLWQEFTRYRFRHLPVVDAEDALVGIVSDRDALQATSFLSSSSYDSPTSASTVLVKDIMKKRVLTASPETNLRELAEVMVSHRVGAVPLMSEEQQLMGIVTRSDILKTLTHQVPVSLWT